MCFTKKVNGLSLLSIFAKKFKKDVLLDSKYACEKHQNGDYNDGLSVVFNVNIGCYCLSQWVYWTNLLEIEFIFSTHQEIATK